MARLIQERAVQTKLMSNVAKLIQVIVSYGRHILMENPTHSKFWKQAFMTQIKNIVGEKHTPRSFLLNRCRVGGKHFKQFKFFMSLPAKHTKHMELTCDHHFRHPPCLGRDANGNSVTKASGVYTTSMVHTIVAVNGLTSGLDNAVKLVGDGLHKLNAKKHKNFRI